MNQYLIGIYKGHLPNSLHNKLMELTSNFTKITSIPISSPQNLTLIVAEEETQLSAGHTDQYFLLTKELQKLKQYEDEFYFVYDYRNRKLIENPMAKCFPLIKVSISGSKLADLIQTVKDIKQDVFAGFKINSGKSGLLIVEVLLTSTMLEIIHRGEIIPESSRSDQHYCYLSKLTELLSDSAICHSILTKAIRGRELFEEKRID